MNSRLTLQSLKIEFGGSSLKYLKLQEFTFPIYDLNYNVYSCEDAATAKGISLNEELKTLILKQSNGSLCALHLPGNKNANFKAIKKSLKINDIFLADKDKDLKKLGTTHGAVCPFIDNIWNLSNLISIDILNLDQVSTNSGKLNSYIFFSPKLLLQNPNKILGEFSK